MKLQARVCVIQGVKENVSVILCSHGTNLVASVDELFYLVKDLFNMCSELRNSFVELNEDSC